MKLYLYVCAIWGPDYAYKLLKIQLCTPAFENHLSSGGCPVYVIRSGVKLVGMYGCKVFEMRGDVIIDKGEIIFLCGCKKFGKID